jgi:antitoxin (DNA-binding transcriptional repressor) of toxin-antitoxin stability system
MSITATELKANLSKYLLLAATEDVFITQYGKIVAKLTNPFQERTEIAQSLFGVLPQTGTFEQSKEEKTSEL